MMERVSPISKELADKLNVLLKNENYPGNVDILVLDFSGNMVVERLKYSDPEKALESAFSLFSACNLISKAFIQGDATECIVHGTKGFIVAIEAGQVILVAAGIPEHQLGLMLQKLRGTAKKVRSVLGNSEEKRESST